MELLGLEDVVDVHTGLVYDMELGVVALDVSCDLRIVLVSQPSWPAKLNPVFIRILILILLLMLTVLLLLLVGVHNSS